MTGWQWRQLDNMQIICTLLKRDNHTPAPHHSIPSFIAPYIASCHSKCAPIMLAFFSGSYCASCSQEVKLSFNKVLQLITGTLASKLSCIIAAKWVMKTFTRVEGTELNCSSGTLSLHYCELTGVLSK